MSPIISKFEDYPPLHRIYHRLNRQNAGKWTIPVIKVLEFVAGTRIRSKMAEKVAIKTYDGLNQTVHPDVIMSDGRYIMAISPYPYSDERYENPCIYVSDNALEFEPAGSNPAFLPTSVASRTHLSDPAICEKDHVYYLFFRESRYFSDSTLNQTVIYRSSSKDLTSWSKPEEVAVSRRDIISPSIILCGNEMIVYYVGTELARTYLARFSLSEGFDGSVRLEVDKIPDGYMIWHVDVVKKGGIYIGLFTLSRGLGGKCADRLHMAVSQDGYSWELKQEIRIEDVPRSKIKAMYKASLVTGEEGMDRLFVSIGWRDGRWSTYVMRNFDSGKYII